MILECSFPLIAAQNIDSSALCMTVSLFVYVDDIFRCVGIRFLSFLLRLLQFLVCHARHCFLLQVHKIRETFVAALEKEFPDLGLKFSIGEWCFQHCFSDLFFFFSDVNKATEKKIKLMSMELTLHGVTKHWSLSLSLSLSSLSLSLSNAHSHSLTFFQFLSTASLFFSSYYQVDRSALTFFLLDGTRRTAFDTSEKDNYKVIHFFGDKTHKVNT